MSSPSICEDCKVKRLVIAIDCDDVLVDTTHDLIQFYNKKYNTELNETDIYTDVPSERFKVGTLREAIERFNERLMMEEYYAIAPSQHTIDAVKRLAAHHELHLVTGRQERLEEATMAMVSTYFPGCFASVEHTNYITADKHAKKRAKGEVCRAIGADVMIDDYIEHVRNVVEAGIPHAIVFGDFDWGKRGPLPKNTVRCATWHDVEVEIERIT